MSNSLSLSQRIEYGLIRAAQGAAMLSTPLSWEKLEIDENRSVWASYTPDYEPNAALDKTETADLCIIGGGYTGISTAYYFSQRYPNKRVILLEAKSLANGASGRNGGMMLNWVYGTGPMSDEVTARVYHSTYRAIDRIEETIKTHDLDVSYRRDGCFEVFTDEARADDARREAAYLNQIGIPIQFLEADQVKKQLNLNGIYGGLFDPSEGQLNGVQFIRALRPVLESRGVKIYENSRVTKITEGKTVEVETTHGKVNAKAIVLAMNGYTGKLGYFRKGFFPLHSHVFATAPLSDTDSAAIGWHGTAGFSDDLNRISYATRTNEGHIVFGGGSNISYGYLFNNRTAYPGTPHSAAASFDDMHRTFGEYLTGAHILEHAHRWTGTLAISLRRNCSIGVRGQHKNVYYALGYSGHGVTAANMAGKALTDIYSDDDKEWRDMPFIQADFSSIPLEPFRWIGYQMMTRLTGRSPRQPHR